MARDVFTATGQRITLGRQLGSGGEGAVFDIGNGLVAKLYHKPPSHEHATKLAVMAGRTRPELLNTAAWPRELISSRPGGSPVGFVMPFVSERHEIFKLYTPVTRKHVFPNADFRFLIFAARNVAIAVSEVHTAHAVVGDLNERNVLVGNDARVVLIDCDSFQVTDNGRIFRCPVGLANYTAPELQGHDFAKVDRSPDTDAFALAVLLFQLLFMARFPFVTALKNGSELTIEEAIRTYRFAWAPDAASRSVQAPPRTLPLQAMGELAPLFVDAFTGGRRRPAPTDWVRALTSVEHNLAKCTRSEGHTFPRSVGRCPWCDLIAEGVSDPFITITIRTATLTSWPIGADPDVLIRLIEALPKQDNVDAILSRTLPTPAGRGFMPPLAQPKPRSRAAPWLWFLTACVALAVLLTDAGRAFTCPAVSVLILALCIVISRTSARKREFEQMNRARRSTLDQEWRNRHSAIEGLKRSLDMAVVEARRHDSDWEDRRRVVIAKLGNGKVRLGVLALSLPQRLKKMEGQLVNIQRDEFLEHFDVEDAMIERFPRSLLKTLKSYGICSAADLIEEKLYGIPGIGEVRRSNLLAWRRERERGFRPDPNRRLTDQDRHRAIFEIAQERDAEAKALQAMAQEYQTRHAHEMARAAALRAAILQARAALLQATADLEAMRASSP